MNVRSILEVPHNRAEIQAEAEFPIAVTPSCGQIENALEFARTTPSISIVYGPAGVSKTTAALRYVENSRTANGWRSAHYVSAGEFNRSPSAILKLIAEKLDIYGRAYRSDDLARGILERLAPNSLIVIDEAQHLSPAALDGLRWFLDEGGIGLAYLGNETVFTRISRGARSEMFAQLHSRVGMLVRITPSAADVEAILDAWQVKGSDERAYALEIAKEPGGLRVLTHVLRQTRLAAFAMKRAVDVSLMRTARAARGLRA